jgi:hypothetical protein
MFSDSTIYILGLIQLTIDKNFYKYGRSGAENNLSQFYAFTNPIRTFPPCAELIFPLAQSFIIFGENAAEKLTPRIFSIHANYSFSGRTVSEETTIDLNQYYLSHPERDLIVEKMDNVVKALKSIAGAVQRINFSMLDNTEPNNFGADEDNSHSRP